MVCRPESGAEVPASAAHFHPSAFNSPLSVARAFTVPGLPIDFQYNRQALKIRGLSLISCFHPSTFNFL
jgi:hypothetical protein